MIAPPSVRGDGEYRWLNDNDIADAPQWLIDLITAKSNGKGRRGRQAARSRSPKRSRELDPQQGLGQGIELPEYPPLPFEPDIKAGCGWLRHVHDTGGADQSEIAMAGCAAGAACSW